MNGLQLADNIIVQDQHVDEADEISCLCAGYTLEVETSLRTTALRIIRLIQIGDNACQEKYDKIGRRSLTS